MLSSNPDFERKTQRTWGKSDFSPLSSGQLSVDITDRCIIRNNNYFSSDFPQGPPAFWISSYLVSATIVGAAPVCKTSSWSNMYVSPGGRLKPGSTGSYALVLGQRNALWSPQTFQRESHWGSTVYMTERVKGGKRKADREVSPWRQSDRKGVQRCREGGVNCEGEVRSNPEQHRRASWPFLRFDCGMQNHQYFDFSFGNSCVSFFKDIFSLFIGSLRRDPSPGPDTGFLL